MPIGIDDPYRGWRVSEVRSALDLRRDREQAYAAAASTAGEPQELRAQRKTAADSASFVAAQQPLVNNGIVQVEGATPGTYLDLRV